MLIDWFTVAAQILNFLILVVLLRALLYKRVVRVIDERRQRIADQFEEAEARERAAAEAAQRYEHEIRMLDAERQEALDGLEAELDATRAQRLEQLRRETALLRQNWQQGISEERERLLEQIQIKVGEAVEDVARAALGTLAEAELEAEVISVFLSNLSDLREAERGQILGIVGSGEPLRVYTAFGLETDARNRIARALRDQFGKEIDVEFCREQGLGFGISARAGGYTIGWNLNEFLESVRDEFVDFLEHDVGTRALDENDPVWHATRGGEEGTGGG